MAMIHTLIEDENDCFEDQILKIQHMICKCKLELQNYNVTLSSRSSSFSSSIFFSCFPIVKQR